LIDHSKRGEVATETGRVSRTSRWDLVAPASIAIAGGLLTAQLVWAAGRALAIVVLAAALASALAPIVRRVSTRWPRSLAVAIVYVAGACVLLGIGWLTIPQFTPELQQLAGRSGEIIAALRRQLEQYIPVAVPIDQMLSMLMERLQQLVRDVPAQIASFFFELLVLVFLSMYFLTISPRMHWFAVTLFRRRQRRRVSLVLCRMTQAMGGYFRGVAINAVIIGALTWIALVAVGVQFTLPLAILAALGEFVPYVGPVVAAIPAIGTALLDSPQRAFVVLLIYVAIQQIEGHLVTPNVMRTQTDVRPASVIVALTVGYTLGGLLGALAAIPIFAAARVLVLRVLVPSIRRSSFADRA
jgi:predicted PurR-regulated permease PerM